MTTTENRTSRIPAAAPTVCAIETLVGVSDWIKALRAEILRIAPHPSSVLISGPSGTGKELAARAIHFHSPRAMQPFIAVDCAAINGPLFTSHVFGHVKSAFTGADHAAIGCFRAADRGTIFLDEIGELELEFQAKLLRVLQQRTVTPVGGHTGVAVDVRILAATNCDLKAMVQAGRFREDLYYRLNVLSLKTIPLKDRTEDIGVLAEHVLARLALRYGMPVKRLSPHWLDCMRRHDWPGNVRELENFLERIALSDGQETHREGVFCLCAGRAAGRHGHPLQSGHVGEFLDCSSGRDGACPWRYAATLDEVIEKPSWPTMAEWERQHILRTLELAEHNQTLAAQLLGISRQHLNRKLKAFGFDLSRCRPGRPRK